MAGTLYGLGLSQRVDSNGKPDVGWQLYTYAANSSTPVTTYSDTALTVALPWPLEADASGMMPGFWLADGAYRARGTSNDASRIFFDNASILAVGPSSGVAPSGGVDPNAIFATGDTMFQEVSGTRAGWVRDNGRTIGPSGSGANERSNADCQALFEFLWNTYSDAKCPVIPSRGSTASADWLDGTKKITLIDKRGVGIVGADDMGNSAASLFTGVPFVDGNATTAASIAGENTHTLLTAEIPVHDHTLNDPGHPHNVEALGVALNAGSTVISSQSGNLHNAGGVVDSAMTGITIANAGGDGAHNNVNRVIVGTWYRKL